jgi:hypothetical protein
MSVYVDQARHRFRRMTMCHMVADTLDELHTMAAAIGMKRRWFQRRSFPHYDLCLSRRQRAIELGAIEINSRYMARWLREQRRMLDMPRNPFANPTLKLDPSRLLR